MSCRIFYSKYVSRRDSYVINICTSAIRYSSTEDIIVIAPTKSLLADIFGIISEQVTPPTFVFVKRRANPYLRIVKEHGVTINIYGFAAPAQKTKGISACGFAPTTLILHDVQDLDPDIFTEIVCPCAYTRPEILIVATCDREMPENHPLSRIEKWEGTRIHHELGLKIIEEEINSPS